MFELDEARSIDRPAAEVWDVLVDFPNVPLWEDGVREVRQTSDGRPTLGTTFVARRVFGGRESMVDCRIIEWEGGRVATMEIIGGPVRRAAARYLVEPTSESACRVEYSINGELQAEIAIAKSPHTIAQCLENPRHRIEHGRHDPPADRQAEGHRDHEDQPGDVQPGSGDRGDPGDDDERKKEGEEDAGVEPHPRIRRSTASPYRSILR